MSNYDDSDRPKSDNYTDVPPPAADFLQGPPKRPDYQKKKMDAQTQRNAETLQAVASQFGGTPDPRNAPPKMFVQTDAESEVSSPTYTAPPNRQFKPVQTSWGGPDAPNEPVMTAKEAGFVDPRQARPTPRQEVPTQAAAPVKPMHPVLSQLRQAFGIEKNPTYEFTLEGIAFKLELINSDRMAIAMRLADAKSASPNEFNIRMKRSVAAAVVTEIAGVAVEDIFEIPHKRAGFLIKEAERRETAIEELYKLLIGEDGKWVMVGEKLYEAYQEKLDPQSNITSSLNAEDAGKIAVRCPNEDCDKGGKAEEKEEMFCPRHGTKMIPSHGFTEEVDLPLA